MQHNFAVVLFPLLMLFKASRSSTVGDQPGSSRGSNGLLWLSNHAAKGELTELSASWYYNGSDSVRGLLENGANVNAQSFKTGRTALMEAAYIGLNELAKLLLDYGARVDLKDWSQMTALHFAAMGDNFDIAKMLIQRGASVNAKDELQWTPLMAASRFTKSDHLMRLLLSRGASREGCTTQLSDRCNLDNTELQRLLCEAAEEGNYPNVRRLLQLGYLDPNWRDELLYKECEYPVKNASALHRAVACQKPGVLEVVKILLDNGADVNLKEHFYEHTALHFAADSGNFQLVKLLIDRGANLEVRNRANWTPLLCAASSAKEETVRLLLSRGALKTPWCDATFSPLCSIDNLPLHMQLVESAGKGDIANLTRLLHPGYLQVNWRDGGVFEDCGYPVKNGTALLRAAACKSPNSVEAVKLLLDNGAEVDAVEEYAGKTALHFAADAGNLPLVQLLLDAKAYINAKTRYNWTPLMFAARWGKMDVVRLLVRRGAARDGCTTAFSVHCDTDLG